MRQRGADLGSVDGDGFAHEVRETGSFGSCVFAKRQVDRGQILVSVPKSACISSVEGRRLWIEGAGKEDRRKKFINPSLTALASLHLAVEALRGTTSAWYPYLCMLPSVSDPQGSCLPLLWERDNTHPCLVRGSAFERDLESLREETEEEFEEFKGSLFKFNHNADLEVKSKMFVWAKAMISSRAYIFPPEREGNATGESEGEGQHEGAVCLLVPFVDLFSHSDDVVDAVTMGDGVFVPRDHVVFTVDRPYRPGEQIFSSYGESLTSHDKALLFGFGDKKGGGGEALSDGTGLFSRRHRTGTKAEGSAECPSSLSALLPSLSCEGRVVVSFRCLLEKGVEGCAHEALETEQRRYRDTRRRRRSERRTQEKSFFSANLRFLRLASSVLFLAPAEESAQAQREYAAREGDQVIRELVEVIEDSEGLTMLGFFGSFLRLLEDGGSDKTVDEDREEGREKQTRRKRQDLVDTVAEGEKLAVFACGLLSLAFLFLSRQQSEAQEDALVSEFSVQPAPKALLSLSSTEGAQSPGEESIKSEDRTGISLPVTPHHSESPETLLGLFAEFQQSLEDLQRKTGRMRPGDPVEEVLLSPAPSPEQILFLVLQTLERAVKGRGKEGNTY
uniref:SET domain-containing protein n=1 Tax=Chromera velia CCMP2878 TaxID=1169474 RepID=A0A0G4HV73_9ALVE|eukprot:Cvel_8803.t1-p1 / transcript=Cvel_8803.t1 / gene=Cvel_8803 / organism=Chromera_velia_CCMP2878 / gene_product=hypothetical protein / transcript_product=hypothetical protein / location=Cvel_scaffold493:38776-41918(+) / protein_length=617 / sequence_SO=supercontig / SO=protein_coding / is_pseudo=false